jgi:hypothetical protein
MIMKLKEEARAHGGCRANEEKMVSLFGPNFGTNFHSYDS